MAVHILSAKHYRGRGLDTMWFEKLVVVRERVAPI
jgi:hypothetical protein